MFDKQVILSSAINGDSELSLQSWLVKAWQCSSRICCFELCHSQIARTVLALRPIEASHFVIQLASVGVRELHPLIFLQEWRFLSRSWSFEYPVS